MSARAQTRSAAKPAPKATSSTKKAVLIVLGWRLAAGGLAALAGSGVEMLTGRPVGSLEVLLAQDFQAVILASGTHQDLRRNIPDEDSHGVEYCLGFLGRVNRGQKVKASRRALIIGGSNSAIDTARTALRLGAEEVTVLAIEDAASLHAHPREVREAREEGVIFKLGLAPPVAIENCAGQNECVKCVVAFLEGKPWRGLREFGVSRGVGEYAAIGEDQPRLPRQELAQRQPKTRRRDFSEVDLGLTPEQAQTEAKRYLQCAVYYECRACEAACTEIGAIDYFRAPRRLALNAPAVIVADETELPALDEKLRADLLDVGSVNYGPDLLNVLLAGTVAAGRAMASAARLRPATELDEPEYEQGAKGWLGFFLCACNHTMAPPAVLAAILAQAGRAPEVANAEMAVSVCQGGGAEAIAKAVKRQELSRVILAYCVCCPLNFHCISCNDQRTRARNHLFERLKLQHCSFETINLRDHLHAGAQNEDALAERARDLLRAAFIRSRYLGPLRAGATEMGRRMLILDGSEAGVVAAQNLACQGLEVRLVHRGRLGCQELPAEVAARPIPVDLGPGVTSVEEAEIIEVASHAGDFSVAANVEGYKRRWQATVLCVTDFHLVPLTIYAGQVGAQEILPLQLRLLQHAPDGRLPPHTQDPGAGEPRRGGRQCSKGLSERPPAQPLGVDHLSCRGCGRCAEICPFDAVTIRPNEDGSFRAEVLRYSCVGCGGCVGRCPVTALDMPYFSNRLLEEMMAGVLAGEG